MLGRSVAERLSAGVWSESPSACGATVVASGRCPAMCRNSNEKLLQRFKAGQLDILVATDVAARGLHIPEVSHVFNFDLPHEAEDYVHRIGRTARLGAEGDAISFACDRYAIALPDIETYIGQSIPVAHMEPELLVMPKPRALDPEYVANAAADSAAFGDVVPPRPGEAPRHGRAGGAHGGSAMALAPATRRAAVGRDVPPVPGQMAVSPCKRVLKARQVRSPRWSLAQLHRLARTVRRNPNPCASRAVTAVVAAGRTGRKMPLRSRRAQPVPAMRQQRPAAPHADRGGHSVNDWTRQPRSVCIDRRARWR